MSRGDLKYIMKHGVKLEYVAILLKFGKMKKAKLKMMRLGVYITRHGGRSGGEYKMVIPEAAAPDGDAVQHKKLLLCDLVCWDAAVNGRGRRRGLLQHVPSTYIRPLSDRPSNLPPPHFSKSHHHHVEQAFIPLIDLDALCGPNRSRVIKHIALACQQDGFFQVLLTTSIRYNFSFKVQQQFTY